MPLPADTKYKVTAALRGTTQSHMVDLLQAVGVEISRLDVTSIDRLTFSIRIRPTDGSAPRYVVVRVSEPW